MTTCYSYLLPSSTPVLPDLSVYVAVLHHATGILCLRGWLDIQPNFSANPAGGVGRKNEHSFRSRIAWLSPVIGVPLLIFYCTYADILSNLIWCGMMIFLSFGALRGLSYTKQQTDAAKNLRYFHIGMLCYVFSEYLLWTAGCFWPNISPASPTSWCDMLLTVAILGLLPATRRAVRP